MRELGWKPQVSFEQGLSNTVDWYAKFSDWWGPIENILTPFPMVKGESNGDAVPANGDSKAGEQENGQQAGSGAQHRTTSKIEAVKLASAKGANGLLGTNGSKAHADGAKKRKADVMDEE